MWQNRFGSDRNVSGRTVQLNGRAYTIIGVMPAGFSFPERTTLWRPLPIDPARLDRGPHYLNVVGRLKAGVTRAQAQADMSALAARLSQQHPEKTSGHGVKIVGLSDIVVGDIGLALYVLLGAVGFVLLIACANVANLLLARSAARQREIAIRIAMGASRFRLIRQLLTESLLLFITGGIFGLLLAKWGVQLITRISPDSVPRFNEINLDSRVVLFTFAICFLTGLLFGLVPAMQYSNPDLNETLKESGRGSTAGLRRQKFRSAMVISEVALSVVLLIGAGLFIRSFYQLVKVDPGFNPEYVLAVQVILPQIRYPETKNTVAFFRQLADRVRELPGVQEVGMSTRVPLDDNQWQSSFWIEGRPDPGPGNHPSAEVTLADPNYHHTVGIKLLKGREFTERDDRDHPFVVMIDESFAKKYWPDEDPIGKRIQFWSDDPKDWPTIVGVVNTIKLNSLDNHEPPRVQLYVPYYRFGDSGMNIVVRASGNPTNLTSSIRDQVRALDKDQPIYDSKTLIQILDESVAPQRLNMLLLGLFAALALVLSAVGIYGVMSYLVTQRTHEIGLRMALGAQIGDVLRLVVGHALALALIGVAIGLPAAFFLTRLTSSLLFGVSATDPTTFVAVPVVLTSIALLASFIPARRASKVDPMVALRSE